MPIPQRLPVVNGDDGTWGDIIVQWLKKEHFDDGTDNAVNGGHETVTIRPGTIGAGTAPLKFTSGPFLTTPEVGAVEFLTDAFYGTITTGAARKVFAFNPMTTGGDLIYGGTSGIETRLANGVAGQVLQSNGTTLAPTWATVAGGGDMVLASIQTVTGAKTFGTIGGAVDIFILAGSTSGSSILNAAAAAGTTTLTLQGITGTIYSTGGTDVAVADGGTGGGTASITLFNNITAFTAAGATGTTSTNLVFSTSPALTTPTVVTSIVGGASFDAFDTTSTTLNIGGAATTLAVGGTPTTTAIHSYSANVTATGTTKTVNLGTAGAAGSTTNINIGSSVASAILGTISLNAPTILTASNNTTVALWNTNATTITFAGAATTLTVGGTPTSAITHNYTTNATATGTTKTVNLGTAGAAGSTTNINIGSSVAGTTTISSPTTSIGATLVTTATTATAFAGATTSLTIGGTGATSVFAIPGTLEQSTTTGALTVAGGVYIAKVLQVVGNIELGSATATTLSGSAGVLSVEGLVIPSISSTNTLTNKRITKRTGTVASAAIPTINTDNVDFFSITAQTEAITSMTTNLSGTPTQAQTLWIAITGTAARAITWGASFSSSTITLPTTTVTTARLDVGFVWNTANSTWRCVAVA